VLHASIQWHSCVQGELGTTASRFFEVDADVPAGEQPDLQGCTVKQL